MPESRSASDALQIQAANQTNLSAQEPKPLNKKADLNAHCKNTDMNDVSRDKYLGDKAVHSQPAQVERCRPSRVRAFVP